jgi:hypothetical protein
MERREFLKALAALGGALAVRPMNSFGAVSPTVVPDARRSKLPASAGLFLAFTDLHNHSLISGDALGDPNSALLDIKAGGIDVACMTEHAISGKDHGQLTCPGWEKGGCHTVEGINGEDWKAMRTIANAAYDPGNFVSFRAFEYSTPTVGHINVWFSEQFTDALHEFAFVTPKAISEADQLIPQLQPIVDPFEQAPDIATIVPFYDWLSSPPDRALLGGGNDGIACFNHPGDYGDFEAWSFHPAAAGRLRMFEAFNTGGYNNPDFFWFGADKGMPNPFNACLNAGWRVGFTGVSDEHSGVYRSHTGIGRGGLWLSSLERDPVRAALLARRGFATLEDNLRLDATTNGHPMGSALAHGSGPVTIELDIDNGPAWVGKSLVVEVVGPGSNAPTLIAAVPVVVPSPDQPPITFVVNVNQADTKWLFLRIIDPARAKHPLGKAPFEQYGGAAAYASPWFFDPPVA